MIDARSLALVLLLALLAACRNEAPPAGDTAMPSPGTATATATVPPSPSPTGTVAPSPTASPSPAAPTPVEETSRRPFDSPEYGIQAFMWWRPDVARRDLQLIDEMGFGWVKQGFAWRDIETNGKGLYDWWKADTIVQQTEEAGLNLLVRLDRQPFWAQADPHPPLENAPPHDLQDFADFCGTLAARYEGRIAAYQVWNEPNLSREWGGQSPDPAAYTELLKACYEEIKAADPQAIVISAGLAPTGSTPPVAMPDDDFLQGMYDAGAAPYFDVLGANAPGYAAPPEMSPQEGAEQFGHRSFVFRRVEDLRAIMEANGDGDKQVAVLEMGWTLDEVNPDYAWFAVDPQTQADYLVRAYEYAEENWQPWIGLMTTIYIADYDWTPEHEQWWWSIVLPDGTPRPAYQALKEMEK
jgi:hypothetical protein